MKPIAWLLLPLLLAVVAAGLPAQAPTPAPAPTALPPIDDEELVVRIEAGSERLRQAGRLRTVDALRAEAAQRASTVLTFAPPAEVRLAPEAVCARAAASTLVVGHFYPCQECKAWHFTGATGFAVAADGVVATCWHLLAPAPEMPGACLCAADYQGRVLAVEAVLAADEAADVCLLRVDRRDLLPLPLRAGVRAGERVYCFSNPDHQFGYFSEGLVARRYRLATEPPPDPHAKAAPAVGARPAAPARPRTVEWLHVTTDFGRGSSGGPILDACGNVVGIAQSTTTVVHDEDAAKPETQMVARSAVPAEALQALAPKPPPAK